MALKKKGGPWPKDSTILGPVDRALVWKCKQFNYPTNCPGSMLICKLQINVGRQFS